MIDYVLEFEIEKLENWLDDLKNEPPTNILLAQRAIRHYKENRPSCIHGLPEPDVYEVEKKNRLIREIEERIAEYRLVERRKRKNIRSITSTNRENMQKLDGTDLSSGNGNKKGRKSMPFINYVIGDVEKCRNALHKAMKNKKGKGAALVIRVAINSGWIDKPTYKAVADEFGYIGHRSGFNKYMDDKYRFSDEEIQGVKAQLGL